MFREFYGSLKFNWCVAFTKHGAIWIATYLDWASPSTSNGFLFLGNAASLSSLSWIYDGKIREIFAMNRQWKTTKHLMLLNVDPNDVHVSSLGGNMWNLAFVCKCLNMYRLYLHLLHMSTLVPNLLVAYWAHSFGKFLVYVDAHNLCVKHGNLTASIIPYHSATLTGQYGGYFPKLRIQFDYASSSKTPGNKWAMRQKTSNEPFTNSGWSHGVPWILC